MPKVVIPVYFDYASTLCYIAWRIVAELEAEMDFAALWKGVPIALRDYRDRPGRPLGPVELGKVRSVVAETGIAVEPPAVWIDSGRALEGSELAREANLFGPYHAAVFRAAFEDRRDIGDLKVLAAIVREIGMDAERFVDDLGRGRMAPLIAENRREADEFSALGYPTFMLGDFPLIGIQPKETMRMLFGRFIARRLAEPQA